MGYSNRFFSFPIRIYDVQSINDWKRETEEAISNGEDPERLVPAWIRGIQKCLVEDIVAYGDGVTEEEEDFEAVAKKGFSSTNVFLKGQGELLCTWPMKKFEKELDNFVAKLGE